MLSKLKAAVKAVAVFLAKPAGRAALVNVVVAVGAAKGLHLSAVNVATVVSAVAVVLGAYVHVKNSAG